MTCLPGRDFASISTLASCIASSALSLPACNANEAFSPALIYTVVANDRGPKGATNVVLTDMLPTNVTFVSSSSTQGFCSRTGSGVTCDFGSLAAGAIAFVRIEVLTPTPRWTLVDSASVTGIEFDPNAKNNSATLSFTYSP